MPAHGAGIGAMVPHGVDRDPRRLDLGFRIMPDEAVAVWGEPGSSTSTAGRTLVKRICIAPAMASRPMLVRLGLPLASRADAVRWTNKASARSAMQR